MILLKLFLTFCRIGLLGFGGGYAVLPQIQEAAIANGWLTGAEYLNLVTLSQMAPGAILINCAAFIGDKNAGLLGGACATLGLIAPTTLIALLFAVIFYKFKSGSFLQKALEILRPFTVGLIAAACFSIALMTFLAANGGPGRIDFIGAALTAAAFAAARLTKLRPVLIIIICGLAGPVLYSLPISLST